MLKNLKAIGLDLGYEPVRRKGAERARDTGNPAATGQIILVQDRAKTPGFLIYLPIYRLGMPINTIAERQSAFLGFIYAPFRVLDLVEEGLPKSVQENFDLVIYNGKDLMYGKADNLANPEIRSHSRYYRKIVVDVAGETWNLYFISKSKFTIAGDNFPKIVLVIGTLTSLLLFAIVLSLSAAYRQTKTAKEISDAAKEAAETANKAKSIFLANMSHELRTPLNAILGFTQIMNRDSSLKEEQIENLGIISRSGEHLLSLINDVLNMSKIEAGRITLNQNNFDIYELLTVLEEMFMLRAEAKGLQLIFNCDPEVTKYVFADESKLRQVLINLLGNAIKFTEEGKVTLRVGVGIQTENNSNKKLISFEVEDTGYGIKSDDIKTLFDALPHRGNILIIDDQLDSLRLLTNILSEQGYEVSSAISGVMALKTLQAIVPDLILLDVNMPHMNGYVICEKLKDNPNTGEIPIIFISALDNTFDKVKAFRVGGIDYITKPFQVEEVLARIENHLHNVRIKKQLQISESIQRERAEKLAQTLEEIQNTQSQFDNEKMSRLIYILPRYVQEINNPVNSIISHIPDAHHYIKDLLRLLALYKKALPKPTTEIEQEIKDIDLESIGSDLPKLLDSIKIASKRIDEIAKSLSSLLK
ncbi:CHASE domain-containing protein [Limnofasciculus baicalensis]|uniref:histidine kinase n=1 Tax=Limnofasciculus baicalensis BBK-W-15 TaxID=2699891 RepID=A0AAE3GZU3_9CYAN|nr:CHASE domain-containing protein [Limnofasciculus baicalensis]MCP2731647.1 CHASE domain-containing protein [Limnofasciculus baicalensis BBK-W-15]